LNTTGLGTFAVIWFGQLISQIGTAMTRFALLIWVYQQTGTATSVALLGFCSLVPLLVVSPFAGVWVDRHDRRRIMLLADLGAGAMTAGVLVLYSTDTLRVWHLYVAEALAGAFEAFQVPAYLAATTQLVPSRHYARAGGLRAVAAFGADSVAPFAAGVVLVWLGIAGVLLVDLATFLVAVTSLAMVSIPRPPQNGAPARGGGPAAFWMEMSAGGRVITENAGLLGLMAIYTGLNLFASLTYFSILPALILARSGRNALALASVQSMEGAAAVAGGLVMSIWGGFRRKIHGVLAGAAISFLLGDLLFALGRDLPVWLLAAFVSAFFFPIIMASDQAIWQEQVPPGLQGRVFAIRGTVRRSTMPVGYLLGGVLADRWFEPAMVQGGRLAPVFGGLVGVGTGAGIAVMFLFTAVAGTLMSLAGYAVAAVREVERRKP
jgi:MFS family permease